MEEREGSEKERETEGSGKGRKGAIIQNILSFLREKLWKGETKVDVALRTILTSWMLWLVAVLFTFIISPLAMRLYWISLSGVFILVFIFGGAILGYMGGNKVIKPYVKNVIIKDMEQLAAHDLWIARISLLIIALILILDVASVAAESYDVGIMIDQYYVYTASIILLVIITMLLGRSLTKMIKRGKG
ncbi:MAG: hypothetical protein IMF19_09780 [Proteobacteria bacterium]|nr:hypothetical protein [Pseudomonadota bacterium]